MNIGSHLVRFVSPPVRLAVVAGACLLLSGCLSFSSTPSPPPAQTVIVPPGSTAVCANGGQPPC